MAFEPDGIGRYLQRKSFSHYEGSEFRTIIHLHRENTSIDQLKHSSTHQEHAAQGTHDTMISRDWWGDHKNSVNNSSEAPIKKPNQKGMTASTDMNVARILMD